MSAAEPERGSPRAPSAQYLTHLRAVRRTRWMVLGGRLLLLVLFLIAWEIAPRMHWVNPMLTSYPSALWPTFLGLLREGRLFHHVQATLVTTVVGFLAGMLLGLLVAVVLWWWSFTQRVLEPYLVVANAMPKIALVPIFYIWLGDVLSIYGIAIAISVFVTILMLYTGFQETDPNKIKLVRTFGATRGQVLGKVVLPGSVPTMIGALKVNVGLALVGVIVGEFQSAKAGLGYLILYGGQILQMNLVMTAVTILAVISTLMYLGIYYLEAAVMRHRRWARWP
jgi:NitT/TauT family transport system permease protein